MFDDKTNAERSISLLIDELLKASSEYSSDGTCDYSDETLEKLKRLKTLMPVWALETKLFDPEEVDRKSNMFGGYPFTSTDYPWVLNDTGNPCYPLVQLDLRQISDLCGKQFGSGLLQVWLDISDSDLSSTIRIIDPAETTMSLIEDYPNPDQIKLVDEYGSWFSISRQIVFKFLGYMLHQWGDGDLEWDYGRDLSGAEVELLNRLEDLSEEHGYRSIKTNWLFGYPDHGSGSPASRYEPETKNLVQLLTADVFPMVSVSRYGNVFYLDGKGEITYFFDWNG